MAGGTKHGKAMSKFEKLLRCHSAMPLTTCASSSFQPSPWLAMKTSGVAAPAGKGARTVTGLLKVTPWGVSSYT